MCRAGPRSTSTRDALDRAVDGDEVSTRSGWPGRVREAELFFSDLGYDYVKINAEYTT